MPRPTDHRQTEATPKAKARATRMRQEMSLPEVLLWREIKNKKLEGLRFRRQHPLGPWIADFYCHDHALVVEVDGRSHSRERLERDRARDDWMQSRRIHVLRIPATTVLNNMPATLNLIRDATKSSPVADGGGGTAKP
ncbi:MAG: endonuclease domain-containing protein [Planctomycetota bacterium]|nr:MAG: endonuclease domain-containing protein [Planctomycetota bacterium]